MPTKTAKIAKLQKHAAPEVPVKSERYVEAIGRRKTANARVRVFFGERNKKQEVIVNGKPYSEYFPLEKQRLIVVAPFKTLSIDGFHAIARVFGGGANAQAEAIRLGIARSFVKESPESRSRLKALGYLTRDSRMVERKHPGLRKARRPQQWRKR
ncbi:MAG: 30S ribosomal protein S9 [Patescibacteria group bacterium]